MLKTVLKITDPQNLRTNGKSKPIQTNHTLKHTHTYSEKEKKEKNIYIAAPNVHGLNLG